MRRFMFGLPCKTAGAMCCLAVLLFGLNLRAAPVKTQAVDKTGPALNARLRNGAELFAGHCAQCHGTAALGDATRLVPALAGQGQRYLLKQLQDFAQRERDSADMHRVVSGTRLRDPHAWADIAAYVHSLPPAASPQHGNANVSLGEAIYREQCASCHDTDAHGDDERLIPAVGNQHYGYLLKQLHGFVEGHRRNVQQDLILYFSSLDGEELAGVADYLSRFRNSAAQRSPGDKGVAAD